MSKRHGPNKENLEATRQTFIDIATEEFTEYGYNQASTSRIVEHSGMARGSLYYHFGDKHGLFKAVYEDMLAKALNTVSDKMEKQDNSWDALLTGSQAFLDLCSEKPFRKITLLESQSAITFEERIALHKGTLLGKLQFLLNDLLNKGYFPGHTPQTITTFIFGILGEIGRSLDFSEDIAADLNTYKQSFVLSIETLAKPS